MATAWEYIRRVIADVDAVNVSLMEQVLRTIGAAPDRPLTSQEVSAMMRDIDVFLMETYGLSPEAARRSQMYRTILSSTDAAAEGPLRSFFGDLERDARRKNPGLWPQIEGRLRAGGTGPNDYMAHVYGAINGPHAQKMRFLRSGMLDPQRKWVPKSQWTTKRGYSLSDRIWKSGRGYRDRINTELRQGMKRGDSPTTVAKRLERYLNPELAGRKYTAGGRVLTRKGRPSGEATYASRRLARTEVKRMHHQATIESARMLPPEVRPGLEWLLSNIHPRKEDICDVYAAQNDYGMAPGVFPVDEVPEVPHPFCACSLAPWIDPKIDLVDVIARKYGI